MKKLILGPELALPMPEAIAQKYAFLGRTGSGKTHAAIKMAEQLLLRGAQVVSLDWVGVWWGLRLQANGKTASEFGQRLYIFGGEHGDVPLDVHAGDRFARLIVDKGVSAVVDLSLMRKGQRQTFVTAFAEEFFHAKKSNRGPVHLFLEEAQAFLPQRSMKGEERLLGAFEDIGKVGRNYGIGLSLISQRPQAVHKDVLNQSEVLFLFQLSGPQERKAVAEWATDVAGESKVKDLDMLPMLNRGECIIWSPQWLQRRDMASVGPRDTFDVKPTAAASAKRAEPQPLTEEDLEALTADIKDVTEKAEQTDVRALQRKLAEAQQELRVSAAQIEGLQKRLGKDRDQLQARVDVLEAALKKRHERMMQRIDALLRRADQTVDALSKGMLALSKDVREQGQARVGHVIGRDAEGHVYEEVRPGVVRQSPAATNRDLNIALRRRPGQRAEATADRLAQPSGAPAEPPATRRPPAAVGTPERRTAAPAANLDDGNAASRILKAAACFAGPVSVRRVAAIAGVPRRKSTWRGAIAALKRDGYVAFNGADHLYLTPAGVTAAGGMPDLPTGPALVDYWRARLGGAARSLFDAAVRRPDGVLAVFSESGVDPHKSTYRGAMATLTGFELVQRLPGGGYRLTDEFRDAAGMKPYDSPQFD